MPPINQLLKRKRVGRDIFYRGTKGGIRSINTPLYDVSLYELLKSYAGLQMQKGFQNISIPKLPVMTTEEGIKQIRNNLDKINDWVNINDLIVDETKIVFVDVTADWCATCQFNKINVLNQENIISLLIENNIKKVRADWTVPNNEIETFLNKHNRFGIPFNAFFSNKYPKGIILSELLSEKEMLKVVEKIKGRLGL